MTKSTFAMEPLAGGRFLRREVLGSPRRFLGKCRRCKRPLSALVAEIVHTGDRAYGLTDTLAIGYVNGVLEFPCNDCGAWSYVRAVAGKFSAKHVCNAKCLASKSGQCECSCGGRNHGASWAA